MNPEAFTSDNTSPESLLAAFDAALFETSLDDDGDVIVRDKYRVFLSVHHESTIRLLGVFGLKEECSVEEGHALCNRINAGLIIIRASVDEDTLYLDWYLPLRGGIGKKAVVRAVRKFNELTEAIIKYDTNNIMI